MTDIIQNKILYFFVSFSGKPVMIGVTMYILSFSSVSEVMMVFFLLQLFIFKYSQLNNN